MARVCGAVAGAMGGKGAPTEKDFLPKWAAEEGQTGEDMLEWARRKFGDVDGLEEAR